jgi:hypothetical protein
MTTVVATREALYSDSRVSFGGAHFTSKKLFRIGDSILGISGTVTDNLKFLDWFSHQNPDESPEFTEDDSFDVVELSPEGLFVWDNALRRIEVIDPFIAVGSGYMAALAALHLGSSPEVAIETACKIDRSSGGPLQTLHLNPSHGSPINNSKGPDSTPGARSRKPKK